MLHGGCIWWLNWLCVFIFNIFYFNLFLGQLECCIIVDNKKGILYREEIPRKNRGGVIIVGC